MDTMEYNAPRVKVIEIDIHDVLCESIDANTGSVTIDGYTEEELDW